MTAPPMDLFDRLFRWISDHPADSGILLIFAIVLAEFTENWISAGTPDRDRLAVLILVGAFSFFGIIMLRKVRP
jgi:hypothetical protein